MYCIINKIESDNNGGMKSTAVAYTTNMMACQEVNSNYESTLGAWIKDNIEGLQNETIPVSDFFNSTPFIHRAELEVDTIEGLNLTEVNNINEL